MTYAVHVKRSAAEALQTIARDERLRLIEPIDRFATIPTPAACSRGSSPVCAACGSAITASSMRCRRSNWWCWSCASDAVATSPAEDRILMLDTDAKRRIDPICVRHMKQRWIDGLRRNRVVVRARRA